MLTSLLVDKLIRLKNKIIKNFLNKYANPPCNSPLATSGAKPVMAESEGKVAALFNEGVLGCTEGELVINETASTVRLAPIVCVVTGLSAAVRKYEECVAEFVGHLSGEESAARHFVLEGEADDNDRFVSIMSGITAVGDAESEGWTFADALARANWSLETLAEGVLSTHLVCLHVSPPSSLTISF